MTLFDFIKSAMYGIWAICFLLDIIIVSSSLLYGNLQLNSKCSIIHTYGVSTVLKGGRRPLFLHFYTYFGIFAVVSKKFWIRYFEICAKYEVNQVTHWS